ncbi:MAG: hypothetical protein ACK5M8_17335, partial [Shewanella algae]
NELVGKVPKQLSGPIDGDKPALKDTLALHQSQPLAIEGVPVDVSFDRFLEKRLSRQKLACVTGKRAKSMAERFA